MARAGAQGTPAERVQGVVMKNLQELCRSFQVEEEGAVASEYAILISGIAVAIFAAVTILGGAVLQLYEEAARKFPA